MSTEGIQASIFGGSDSEVATIETDGRTLRPILSMVTAIRDDAELHVYADDGLRTTIVDPANVSMLDLKVRPAAFESFDVHVDESTISIPFDELQSRASYARMGSRTNDAVTLDIDDRRALVTVEREYNETTVRQTEEVLNIDPDEIREQPNMPDLELDWQAEIDPRAFVDTVDHMGSDHVDIREDDGRFVLATKGFDDENSEFDGLADFGLIAEDLADSPEEGASGLYSSDYLTSIAKGLRNGKIDTLRIEWADEFPMKFHFKRFVDDGEEVAYEGQYMLAPRISSDE